MIKAVLIDIDNTLLDFNASAKQAMRLAFEKAGLPFDESVLPTFIRINDGLWRKIENKLMTREELHANRWNIILAALGIDYDGTRIEKDFLSNLDFCAVPVDGALDILEYLSEKYYLCTASNAPREQQYKRMKVSGIDRHIQKAFISQEIGADKPSKEFFDGCFRAMHGITPRETVIIGDSLSADIGGGKEYGLKTVWCNFYGKQDPLQLADYTVSALSEIKSIL